MSELAITALSITAVTATTDPTVSQYDDTFGLVFKEFEKLMGQDYKPTDFKSSKAVQDELDKTVLLFDGFRAGNEGLKTWLESYVDLLFMVSGSVWEATQAPPSPEKIICNAIVVLIETAYKVDERYKSLLDFFDRLQYYLQRVYDFYGFTELSNVAGIKLLLLKVMAEALSAMVDYIKSMRVKPIRKVLKVLTRKKDVNRISMPRRMDSLTNEGTLLSVSRMPRTSESAASERHDSRGATPTGEKPTLDTGDNLDGIQEVDYKADDGALAPQGDTTEEKSQMAPPDGEHKAESTTDGKGVSPDLPRDVVVQKWLNPPDPPDPTLGSARLPGAGKWFIQGKTFRWWKRKETGASLVICGESGSGKTFLCSSIVAEIKRPRNKTEYVADLKRTRNKTEIVAHYHFDSEPDKHNLRGLLASLVSQLCISSNHHPKSLLDKCGNGSNPPSEAELTQHLNDVLDDLKKAQFLIFIVIDGVDNCTETKSGDSPRKKVLKFLLGLVRARHSNLYICITSTLNKDMEKSLKQMAAVPSSRQVILHQQEGQKEDIKTYIADFVQKNMSEWPADKKDEVITKLSKEAGGMFGWISKQLNALHGKIPSGPDEVLERVGTPRDEEFAQALNGIPEEKSGYAVPLFQCLIAAIRPLSLKELADISKELDPNADLNAVISAYPALIACDPNDSTIVQFAHESVKDFLISDRLRTSSTENALRSRFLLKDAHATLARVCVKVLLRFDEPADKTQLESSPLALYAAQYWVEHTQRGEAATKNQDVMEILFDKNKSHLKAWICMYDIDKVQSRTTENVAEPPSSRIRTPLYYAALCGFTELVNRLADLYDRRDSIGNHGTPLHAASYKGYDETVDALLAIVGSDLEKVNKKVDKKTPLHAAYYGGHLKIMKALLDKGAEVDATGTLDTTSGTSDTPGNTLLHCASLDGQVEVVDLLLEFEANINAKNENGWTPLHRATLGGQVRVAERLLNFTSKNENDKNPKALVDAQSLDKNTPLHVAAIIGNLPIVELLLGHKANREIEGEHGWTPLEAAVENRHKKIAERLARSDPWWSQWGGGELRRRGMEKWREFRKHTHTSG